jgi:hypothetical protein
MPFIITYTKAVTEYVDTQPEADVLLADLDADPTIGRIKATYELSEAAKWVRADDATFTEDGPLTRLAKSVREARALANLPAVGSEAYQNRDYR